MISWVHHLLPIYLEQMMGPLDQADKSKLLKISYIIAYSGFEKRTIYKGTPCTFHYILFLGIDNAKEPITKVPSWEVGAFCRGVYKEDGLEYEG